MHGDVQLKFNPTPMLKFRNIKINDVLTSYLKSFLIIYCDGVGWCMVKMENSK